MECITCGLLVDMNEQNYYRVSIKGIAIDTDGRVLLTREDNNKWELLGGGLDHGEDPKECLVREIKEETGLTVTSISDAPIYFLTCPRLGHDSFVANVIYQITLENLDFTPSDECQELRFVSVDEMKTLDLFPNVQKLSELLISSPPQANHH